MGEGGEGDEEECRTSGAVPGVKLKPSPTLLSKVPFSSKFSSSSFSIQDKIGFLVLLLVLQLLNYFCPVSLSRRSWTRCSRRPSCPPLKFTLLCNRQKTLQIFPRKHSLHARIQKSRQIRIGRLSIRTFLASCC